MMTKLMMACGEPNRSKPHFIIIGSADMTFLGGQVGVSRIPSRNKCFCGETKILGESKNAKINFHTSLSRKKAEVCSCTEGKQKPEYCSGQAVNPLKPGVIHRHCRANSTSCCKTEL